MKELPTVPSGPPTPEDGQTPPGPPQVSSGKLTATLAVAGAIAGLIIVLVFQWADPRIQRHRAEALRAAVLEVLHGPDTYRSLYVTPDGLKEVPPAGVDTVTAEKVFIGFDAAGEPVGYAVTGAEPGFQDVVELIFGFDAHAGRVLAMKVLESKETPGLGDRIIKDTAFVGEFRDVAVPLVGVKRGAGSGVENEVDMITGATISSRTVIRIVNHRIEAVGDLLEEHAAASGRASAVTGEAVAPNGEEGS